MISILLVLHLLVTLAMIGVVLIQRSEGGGLGIGTTQGMGSFMGGRGTANLLTRTTAVLGALFFILSLALALLNRGTAGVGHDLLSTPPASRQSAPSGLPVPPSPAAPVDARPGSPPTPAQPSAVQPPAPTGPQVPTK